MLENLIKSGYYWYKGIFNPKEWTIIYYDSTSIHYPFEAIGSDEIFTKKDFLPGEFIGPLNPPNS